MKGIPLLLVVLWGRMGETADKNKSCCGWAGRGECQKNPKYMLATCPKACANGCTAAEKAPFVLPGRGQDKSPSCCWWAQKDECNKNPSYMRVYCQKSCGTTGCTGTMDPKVNPCDDFYMHACGNAGPQNVPMMEQLQDTMGKRMTKILNDAAMPKDFKGDANLENAFKKMQALYKTSKSVDLGSPAMKEIVQDLGGIPWIDKKSPNPFQTAAELQLYWNINDVAGEKEAKVQKPILSATVEENRAKAGYHWLSIVLLTPNNIDRAMNAIKGYAAEHGLTAPSLTVMQTEYNKFLTDAKPVTVDFMDSLSKSYKSVKTEMPLLHQGFSNTYKQKMDAFTDMDVNIQAKGTTQLNDLVNKHKATVQSVLVGQFLSAFYDSNGPNQPTDWRSDLLVTMLSRKDGASYKLMHLPEKILERTYAHYHGPNNENLEEFLNIRKGVEMTRRALMRRVAELDWLDTASKFRVLDKLNAVVTRIGNADWVLNNQILSSHYQDLPTTTRTDFLALMRDFAVNRRGAAIRSLTFAVPRRTATFMGNTFTINANYFAPENAINMYQGLMASPLYDVNYPIEAIVGPLGGVVAHEFTHAIDVGGSEMDRRGVMRDILTPASRTKITQLAGCLEKLYAGFCIPNQFCIGKEASKKMSDIVADYGGARIAFKALMDSVKDGEKTHVIPGFEKNTVEQMFFYSWAGFFCKKKSYWSDKASLQEQLKDEHPNDWSRVKLTLQNFPEFAKAFNCPNGSPMKPPTNKLCPLW